MGVDEIIKSIQINVINIVILMVTILSSVGEITSKQWNRYPFTTNSAIQYNVPLDVSDCGAAIAIRSLLNITCKAGCSSKESESENGGRIFHRYHFHHVPIRIESGGATL
jgi:hypothetical protein